MNWEKKGIWDLLFPVAVYFKFFSHKVFSSFAAIYFLHKSSMGCMMCQMLQRKKKTLELWYRYLLRTTTQNTAFVCWMTKMFTVIYMWKCANDVVHVTSSTFWNVSRHQHVNIPVRRQHMLHPFGANNLAQLLCIVFWIDDYTCQSICCNSGPASWIFQHVAQLRVEVAILRQFIKDQMLGSP